MAARTVRFSNTSKTDDGEAAKQYELFFARVFGCLPRQGQYRKNITTPEAKLLIDRQRRGFIWHKQKFNLQYSPPISPQNSWQQIHPSFQLDVMKRTADFFVRFDQAIALWKKVGGKPKPVPIRNLGGGFGFKLSLNDPPSIECVQSIRTCLLLSDHCQWFALLDEMAAYNVKQVNQILVAKKFPTSQLSYGTDDYDSFPDETSSYSSEEEDDWGRHDYDNYVSPLELESKSPAKAAAAEAAAVARLAANNHKHSFVWRSLLYQMPGAFIG